LKTWLILETQLLFETRLLLEVLRYLKKLLIFWRSGAWQSDFGGDPGHSLDPGITVWIQKFLKDFFWIKLFVELGHGRRNNQLHFGDDLDHNPDNDYDF